MSFLERLFATAPPPAERDAAAAAVQQLSVESILQLLKGSRSPAQARYAGLLLREYVATHAPAQRHAARESADHALSADSQSEALSLLRSARTPFEAKVATEALKVAVGASAPDQEVARTDRSVETYTVMPLSEVLQTVSVLVVEDDPHYRQLLVTTLERSGAKVTATGSVDEAMKLITANAPDVVVSDIELPRASGYDLMERINRRSPQIPVLAISAHPQDMTSLSDAGFRFFFSKEPGVLRDIVNTIAHMPSVVASPTLPIVTKPRRKPPVSRE